jgi:hypothetical protein
VDLTEANRAALEHVRAPGGAGDRTLDAPITLNFHPDRRTFDLEGESIEAQIHGPLEPPGDEWEWERFCADGRLRRLAERVGVPLDAAKIGAADVPVQQRKYLWWVVVRYAA